MRHSLASSVLAALVTVLLAPDAAAIGILVPTNPSASPMVLRSHRVTADVTERGAKTHVIQEFENPTGAPLEATYLFPLPKDASIDEFALWMNGKRETGKVLERGEARRIYESIVRQVKDPGLIEYVDAQLFQARVFPVPANGRLKVELIYSHVVDYAGGVHRYVYPMKTDARATRTLEDFTFTVNVSSKLPVRNLFSPTHRVAARTNDRKGVASFEMSAFSLADDFVLTWGIDDSDVGVTLMTYQTGDDAGYFMLLASPKDGAREKQIIGKRVSFVVDTSGSMMGEKMTATKSALDHCIKGLGEDDLFNVITFGGYVESFQERMVAASSRNVASAREFVSKIEPIGGTNIDDALRAALDGATGSSKAPHLVVFLTDGRPTIGETDTKQLLNMVKSKNGEGARLFVFGVGDDVNTVLLDSLAEDHGGSAAYLAGDASLKDDIAQFWDRVSHPVFSDLKLTIDGVRVFGEHPRRLPDLFRGGQLVLLGRYKGDGKATVALSGTSPKGRQNFSWKTTFSKNDTAHGFIPRLWAQRQVGMLLAEIREKGESKGLIDEVTQLATRFGIVTPYTSYLVVEPTAERPVADTRMPRPTESPSRRMSPPMPTSVFAPEALSSASDDAAFGAGGFGDGHGKDSDGSGGLGRGSAPSTTTGAAAPSKKGISRGRDALREESGETAVRAAREIAKLKDSTSSSSEKVATKELHVDGRVFRFDGVTFKDAASSTKDAILNIAPYSNAYFRVLALRPDLKSAFALGGAVSIQVGPGKTLLVSSTGKADVNDDELRRFVAAGAK